MARPDQDENIPFFAPATAPTKDEVTDRDADDLTTLQSVQKILESSLEDLKMDVTKLNADDVQKLQAQILGKQEAYAILEPVKQMVDSAIESVIMQRKGL
jgi:hypothetical protein